DGRHLPVARGDLCSVRRRGVSPRGARAGGGLEGDQPRRPACQGGHTAARRHHDAEPQRRRVRAREGAHPQGQTAGRRNRGPGAPREPARPPCPALTYAVVLAVAAFRASVTSGTLDGTTTTGHGATCSSRVVTDPSSRPATGPWPRVPVTMR